LPGSNFYSVDIDNRLAARQAVEYLIGLGHRQIACITNAPFSYSASADRLLGYREALEQAGIPFDESLVRFGDFEPESGYTQMSSLLASGIPFTAGFIASDAVLIGANAALREHGLCIPADISSLDHSPLTCPGNWKAGLHDADANTERSGYSREKHCITNGINHTQILQKLVNNIHIPLFFEFSRWRCADQISLTEFFL
jgi:hypothetical protein